MKWVRSGWYILLSIGCGLCILLLVFRLLNTPETKPQSTTSKDLFQKPNVKKPNIILVTVECLRSDHVSSYGYDRNTTPNTDQFFKNGVRFDQAIASSSWTLPSIVSLFTSLYPQQHGAITGFFSETDQTVSQQKLSPELVFVTDVLSQNGYYTYGLSTNPHLTSLWGFESHFDRLDDYNLFGDAASVVERILSKRKHLEENQPFFLWIHFFDPHWPYYPKLPWIKNYNHTKPKIPSDLYQNFFKDQIAKYHLTPPHPLFEYLLDCYDSEIAFWDYWMQKIYDAFDKTDTVFIVAGDHGEGFYEHGEVDHGYSLNSELLRVPLFIKFPGKIFENQTVSDPVSLMDLAPTILHVARIEQKPSFCGSNLVDALQEPSKNTNRYALAHLNNFNINQISIENTQWKLIGDIYKNRYYLYDKTFDASETMDYYQVNTETAEIMIRAYYEIVKEADKYRAQP
ncbi:sulfatase, partial [bacterium]|nr:sulfatase [candidate division CSSED10-310 bacterium]